jgi:hypothetical protein
MNACAFNWLQRKWPTPISVSHGSLLVQRTRGAVMLTTHAEHRSLDTVRRVLAHGLERAEARIVLCLVVHGNGVLRRATSKW